LLLSRVAEALHKLAGAIQKHKWHSGYDFAQVDDHFPSVVWRRERKGEQREE
jgi:hypothetical protein